MPHELNTPPLRSAYLHIFLLTGFAVAQPLYDLLARQAEFFVARNSGQLDLFALVFTLSLAAPIVLGAPVALCHRYAPRLYRACCATIIGLLFGLLALIACKQSGIATGPGALLLALLTAGIGALAYVKLPVLQRLLSVAAPAALLFPALFLLSPNTLTATSFGNTWFTGAKEMADSRASSTPIVVVVFDELALYPLLDDNGMIDADRFPNFATLAQESTWYRNATTVVPVTNYAVPAIVSGRYPAVEALPVAAHYPQTLFTLLRDTHSLNVTETVTRLCPVNICESKRKPKTYKDTISLLQDTALVYGHMAVPEAYIYLLPPLGNRWGGFFEPTKNLGIAAEYKRQESRIRDAIKQSFKLDRMQNYERFLGSIGPWESGPPPLYFLHMLFPHTPWKYYASGKRYMKGDGHRAPGMDKQNILWGDNADLVAQGYQRYLLQVALLDKLLGQLLARLHETGWYNEALLIVTSDHGASFSTGQGYRKLTAENYHDVLPVPLFIRFPGQTGFQVDDSNIELIDILPTVAATLGLELESEIPGKIIGSAAIESRTSKRMYDFFSLWSNNPIDVENNLVARFIKSESANPVATNSMRSNQSTGLMSEGIYHAEISSFRIVQSTQKIRVEQLAELRNINVSGDYLPGYISGKFRDQEFAAAQQGSLLLALNGRVRARAARYIDDKGRQAFSALLPEASFRQGENVLRAFLARNEDEEVWLEELVLD